MLIPKERWGEEQVPSELIKYIAVDLLLDYPTGIGYSKELGWYIGMGGSGAFIPWSEKEYGWDVLREYNEGSTERAFLGIQNGLFRMASWLRNPNTKTEIPHDLPTFKALRIRYEFLDSGQLDAAITEALTENVNFSSILLNEHTLDGLTFRVNPPNSKVRIIRWRRPQSYNSDLVGSIPFKIDPSMPDNTWRLG